MSMHHHADTLPKQQALHTTVNTEHTTQLCPLSSPGHSHQPTRTRTPNCNSREATARAPPDRRSTAPPAACALPVDGRDGPPLSGSSPPQLHLHLRRRHRCSKRVDLASTGALARALARGCPQSRCGGRSCSGDVGAVAIGCSPPASWSCTRGGRVKGERRKHQADEGGGNGGK